MPKITYIKKNFHQTSLALIAKANEIINEYMAKGYSLTLRQLYYQFVARDLLANNQKNYKNLGAILSDARLAGMVDWDALEDRTRNLRKSPTWSSPADIVAACAGQFDVDLWQDQPNRVEVWIEKDALVGVIERVCHQWQVPYFACRGYTSQSEAWEAGQRLLNHIDNGQEPIVLHLGDHDPSGLDMTRDNGSRLDLFTGGVKIKRLALNMNQVKRYNPPPNPAKETDTRHADYVNEYGPSCWELDALDPEVISNLIDDEISKLVDINKFDSMTKQRDKGRKELKTVADAWPKAVAACRKRG